MACEGITDDDDEADDDDDDDDNNSYSSDKEWLANKQKGIFKPILRSAITPLLPKASFSFPPEFS